MAKGTQSTHSIVTGDTSRSNIDSSKLYALEGTEPRWEVALLQISTTATTTMTHFRSQSLKLTDRFACF